MRTITIVPAEPGVGPEKITMEFTVYPIALQKEEANLDKVAMSLVMKGRHALRKQLQEFVDRQANLIAATSGFRK